MAENKLRESWIVLNSSMKQHIYNYKEIRSGGRQGGEDDSRDTTLTTLASSLRLRGDGVLTVYPHCAQKHRTEKYLKTEDESQSIRETISSTWSCGDCCGVEVVSESVCPNFDRYVPPASSSSPQIGTFLRIGSSVWEVMLTSI